MSSSRPASPPQKKNIPTTFISMKQKAVSQDMVKERKGAPYHGIYFLGFVVFVYFLLFLFQPEKIKQSLKISTDVLLQILPSLLLIILLMGIMNCFVNPRTVSKYVGKGSGIKGWLLAILTGILSHGPVYAWYPLLRDLRIPPGARRVVVERARHLRQSFSVLPAGHARRVLRGRPGRGRRRCRLHTQLGQRQYRPRP